MWHRSCRREDYQDKVSSVKLGSPGRNQCQGGMLSDATRMPNKSVDPRLFMRQGVAVCLIFRIWVMCPQFLVGLGKCAVSFVNHYQVWPVIFHILPMVWQPLDEQTNPSSFRMPYRTTVSSICSTSSRRWVAIHTLCLYRSCKCSWMTDTSEWSLPIPVGICTIMFLFNLHVSDTHSLMLCW